MTGQREVNGADPTEHPRRPLVSVVIPAFNAGPFLEEQLRALAAQDLEAPWEVIIADNGTTDGSIDVARAFTGDLTIRVVDASAISGPSHARNAGVVAAGGHWIAFCDADDKVDRSWLRLLLLAGSENALVAGALEVTQVNAPHVWPARGGRDAWTRIQDGPCGFLPYAATCNLLVERRVFDDLGGFDETLPYCEDVDFSWRAQLQGYRLAYGAGAVVHYRFRPRPLDALRQQLRFASAEPLLFERFRLLGARRESVFVSLERMWWVLSRSPYLVLDRRRRYLWCTIAGGVMGRIRGSIRHRILYL